MKTNLATLTMLAAATLVAAQSAPSKSPSPAQGAQTQTQPATATHQPQAKTKDEFDAYQAAAAETDPAKLEAAADAFAQKYPTSDLRGLLYVRDMSLYQQANNAAKVIEVGRKAIVIDATNPVPLVNTASALAETTHDSDLDHEARLNEAGKDAQSAIDNMSNLQVPPNVSADRVAQVKASILSMAYDALAVVEMNKKDYATAEQNLLKATDASKNQPEGVIYLRLSVVQDNLKKYPEALDSATKAVQYSPDGSPEQNLAKQQVSRVQKLMMSAPAPAPGSSPSPAPSNNPNPPNPQTQTPPPQPH
jgi:tetratricopeptide (TPR) repeat protein